MPPLLVWFLVNAAGHPLLVGLGPAVVVAVLVWWLGRDSERFSSWSRAATAALAGAALVAYGTCVIWYATDAHYFDAAEPTMTIVGWLFMHGQPLYPEQASAERYAHIYGPLAFIAHGMVQRAFGPSIEASKWLGAAAGLIGLVSIWLALAPVTTRSRALVLTGACGLVYLAFRNYTFWTRPDAMLIAGVALGLLAAVRAQGIAAAIGVGLAAGVLANLKFTGPLYAAPLVAVLALGSRPWLAWVAVAIASVTAAAPFLLPNVSLMSYIAWIRLSAANGLLPTMLRHNVEWSAFLLLPIVLIWFSAENESRPRDRGFRGGLAVLIAGMAMVAVAASKPGAGPYHLLPFVPVIAFTAARILAKRPPPPGPRPLAAPGASSGSSPPRSWRSLGSGSSCGCCARHAAAMKPAIWRGSSTRIRASSSRWRTTATTGPRTPGRC